jgi:hypothetical protein
MDTIQIVQESLEDLLPVNGVEGGKPRVSHSSRGKYFVLVPRDCY